MCQIIGISNITGLSRTQINSLALKSKDLVRSQKDGFGWCYAAKPRNGKSNHNYYCEKYVDPQSFKGIGSVGYSKRHLRGLTKAINMPMLSSGHPDAPIGGFLAHGRISTNAKNIVNTHPFRKKRWAMVHNGVVDLAWSQHDPDGTKADLNKMGFNTKLLAKRYSSCDSEWLLNTYIHAHGHHNWCEILEGYAATLTIAPDGTFIAAKDDAAYLYLSVIPELNDGAIIFGTAPHFAGELAKSIQMTCTPSFEINSCTAIIISPTGSIKLESFESMDSCTSVGFHDNANKAFGWKDKANKKKGVTTHTYPDKSNYYNSDTNSYWIKEKERVNNVKDTLPSTTLNISKGDLL